MKKSETNDKCKYYNWGGGKGYVSYPREYGARCEKYNEFFSRANGKLTPQCHGCRFSNEKK